LSRVSAGRASPPLVEPVETHRPQDFDKLNQRANNPLVEYHDER